MLLVDIKEEKTEFLSKEMRWERARIYGLDEVMTGELVEFEESTIDIADKLPIFFLKVSWAHNYYILLL